MSERDQPVTSRVWTTFVLLSLLITVIAGCRGDQAPTPAPPTAATEAVYPVQSFPDQGRQHLQPGQTFTGYNSNPPTSGPHSPAAAPWGIYDRPIPKEVLVHNMEHGGVVIWYNCQGGPQPLSERQCQELRDNLARVVQAFLGERKLVSMAPYPDMPRRLALTAWTKLDTFDEFDEARISSFIRHYERAFNPEGF